MHNFNYSQLTPENARIAKKRFIALDFETTGFSRLRDRIIEIGAVLFEGGEPSKVLSTLVNPSMDINPAATSVNGITMQMVRNSPSQEEAAELLDDFLSEAKSGQVPIVGHNVKFDLGFLEALWRRHLGCSYSIEAFDTCQISRRFLCLPGYKQSEVASYYGIVNEKAHRAYEDAVCCGRIFLRLCEEVEQTY